MRLSSFEVLYERHDAAQLLDDPLIRCFVGDQMVALACVKRSALMDRFRVPGDRIITLNEWNVVVESNLAAFEAIIQRKYDSGDLSRGKSYSTIIVTLQDMERGGHDFSMSVLDVKGHFAGAQ
jgi:hypothetical protein